MSLYRKYRPQDFSDIVGQSHITTVLSNAVKMKAVSHAYLFSGPRGTGKTSMARILAKVINCERPLDDGNPCLECRFCQDIKDNRLIDVIEIDAASNRGIDEIRDLNEMIKFMPTYATKKVYIIDEVHMLTKEAFNALLKTLEEPPSHVNFILATTEIHKVPETIISRCQRFDFHRISVNDIQKRLEFIADKENVKADEQSINKIAQSAEGGLRDGIGLFEQMIEHGEISYERLKRHLGFADSSAVASFVDLLFDQKLSTLMNNIDNLFKKGHDLQQFTKELIEYLRNQLLESVKNQDNDKMAEIIEVIKSFQDSVYQMNDSVIPQLPLEIAVIKANNILIKKSKFTSKLKNEGLQDDKYSIIRQNINEAAIKTQPNRVHRLIEQNKENIAITETYLKDNLTRILDLIPNPSVRRSFKEGKLLEIKENELIFGFDSEFHLEKVQKATNNAEISSAIEKVFGKSFVINCLYQPVSLTVDSETSKKPSNTDLFTQSVAQMFGGEVVE